MGNHKIAPDTLNVVHRFVAGRNELVPSVCGCLNLRKSKACVYICTYLAMNDIEFFDIVAKPLCNLDCNVHRCIGQKDGKLIAAEAGKQIVLTHAKLKALSHGDKSCISAVVPIGVVDALEVIEVDKDCREWRLCLSAVNDRLRCSGLHSSTVEQAGEGVGRGQNLKVMSKICGGHPYKGDQSATLEGRVEKKDPREECASLQIVVWRTMHRDTQDADKAAQTEQNEHKAE